MGNPTDYSSVQFSTDMELDKLIAHSTPIHEFKPPRASTPYPEKFKETNDNDVSHPRMLFGCIKVKTITAFLTILYLYGILRFDQHMYISFANMEKYSISVIISISMLALVVLAQLGLHREKASFVFPLLGAQVIGLILIYVIWGRVTMGLVQKSDSNIDRGNSTNTSNVNCYLLSIVKNLSVRLFMLLIYQVFVVGLHMYSIVATYRCCRFFSEKKGLLKDRLAIFQVATDEDDDLVVFDSYVSSLP
uniref:Uncharacterized protein n=1 Tax=Heterorhabditis bacteriophora TaxID=37862 RepID=A0A1I7XF12_HETBA